MVKAGTKFSRLSPEEKQRWREQATPKIWDSWINELEGKGLPAKQTLEQYRSLIKKYDSNKYVSPYELYDQKYKR